MLEAHHAVGVTEAPVITVSARKVRQRYDGISNTTLTRWLERKSFPAPVYLSGRRYWRQSDLAKWERAQQAIKREQDSL